MLNKLVEDLEHWEDPDDFSAGDIEAQIAKLQDELSQSRLDHNLFHDYEYDKVSMNDELRSWGSVSTISVSNASLSSSSATELSLFDEIGSQIFSDVSESSPVQAVPQKERRIKKYALNIKGLQVPYGFNLPETLAFDCHDAKVQLKKSTMLIPAKKEKNVYNIRTGALNSISFQVYDDIEEIKVKLYPGAKNKPAQDWNFVGVIPVSQLMGSTLCETQLLDMSYIGKRGIPPKMNLRWTPASIKTPLHAPNVSRATEDPVDKVSVQTPRSFKQQLLYLHVHVQDVSLFHRDPDSSYYGVVKIPMMGSVSQGTFFCNHFSHSDVGDQSGRTDFHYTIPLARHERSQSIIIESYLTSKSINSSLETKQESFLGISRFPLAFLSTAVDEAFADASYVVLPSSRIPIINLITGIIQGYFTLTVAVGPWQKIQEFKESNKLKIEPDLRPSRPVTQLSDISSNASEEHVSHEVSLVEIINDDSRIAEIGVRLIVYNIHGLDLLVPQLHDLPQTEFHLEFVLPDDIKFSESKRIVKTDAFCLSLLDDLNMGLDISLPGNLVHFNTLNGLGICIQGYLWCQNLSDNVDSRPKLVGQFEIPLVTCMLQLNTQIAISIHSVNSGVNSLATMILASVSSTESPVDPLLPPEGPDIIQDEYISLHLQSFELRYNNHELFESESGMSAVWEVSQFPFTQPDLKALDGSAVFSSSLLRHVINGSAVVQLLLHDGKTLLGRVVLDLKDAYHSFAQTNESLVFSQTYPLIPCLHQQNSQFTQLHIELTLELGRYTQLSKEIQTTPQPIQTAHFVMTVTRGVDIILPQALSGLPCTFVSICTAASRSMELISPSVVSTISLSTRDPVWNFKQELRLLDVSDEMLAFDDSDEPLLALQIWHTDSTVLEERSSSQLVTATAKDLEELVAQEKIQLVGNVFVPLGLLLRSVDFIEGWYNVSDPSDTLETCGDVFVSVRPCDDFLKLIHERRQQQV